MTRLPPFEIERFFAVHEFAVPYLLCASDVEPLSLRELLAYADDVIISAGYRIGPFEVESALLEHPAVLESAVVASPDPVRGEIVKAFVVLREGQARGDALAHALQDHVKKVTAPYKYPREIEFVDSLPKTVSGKIRRVELRERERKAKASRTPA